MEPAPVADPQPVPKQMPPPQLAFVREWQADLCAVYPAAEAGGFDSASVEKVEATIDRMTNMWWHVGQLQPAWLSALAFRMYPENSGQASKAEKPASDSGGAAVRCKPGVLGQRQAAACPAAGTCYPHVRHNDARCKPLSFHPSAPSLQLPLWREIAAEVLPELNERSRALVVST